MKINGFQKMTLLDFPGKVACTIFTAGCNFRCGFCHNAALVTHINDDDSFSEEEILAYLSKRQGLLEGVCITGGEPLMQSGIEDFLRKVKELDDIKSIIKLLVDALVIISNKLSFVFV